MIDRVLKEIKTLENLEKNELPNDGTQLRVCNCGNKTFFIAKTKQGYQEDDDFYCTQCGKQY